MRKFFLAIGLGLLMRLSRLLWRVVIEGEPHPKAGPQLYAHWHGDELILVPVFARRGYAVMASRSRDGEWMAALLRFLGYHVVRGSSSRGGAGGLKGLVDAVRQDRRSAAIAVDGPRGPIYRVKPGILFLAQTTGLAIVPCAADAKWKWNIPGAWNQGYFPKPFSRCAIVFGEPVHIPLNCSTADLERYRERLEKRLEIVKKQAVQLAGHSYISATATKSSRVPSSNP